MQKKEGIEVAYNQRFFLGKKGFDPDYRDQEVDFELATEYHISFGSLRCLDFKYLGNFQKPICTCNLPTK